MPRMGSNAWNPAAFEQGANMALPADPDGRRDVAVSILRRGDVALAHEVAFRAIDRYHDKTFDNFVSGEKTREFLFERGSIAAFITSTQLLINDPARGSAPVPHLEEVYLRLDSDRPNVYRYGPSMARAWVDTAICSLLIQRYLVGSSNQGETRELVDLLAGSNGGTGATAVPQQLLVHLPSEKIRATAEGDYDPLTFAQGMQVSNPQVDVRSSRQAFAEELSRMASANFSFFTKHDVIMRALENEIATGAEFVNIFHAPKSKSYLVVTTNSVCLITPKLFGAPTLKQLAMTDIANVQIHRRPFKNCLSIDIIVTGRATEISYKFGFECNHGFDDPILQERLSTALHNAEIAAAEIDGWRQR